ncbi:MAG: DeoR/GlpR transcriptional regulator [Clostridia bacterium]|nr:DeoR/GlpR transcriptional regulator [Clostridia bacterium]
MLQIERQEQIMELLGRTPALRIGQIAAALYTSEATVRRDLAVMEQKGLVQRVYGGVTLKKEDLPLDFRRQEHAAAKEEIALRAAAMIKDGQTVFLDSSSTAQHLLPHLARFRELTVITNSHRAVEVLATSKVRLVCTGGDLIPRNMAFVGRVAEHALEQLCPEIAFFSSQGVGGDGEVTDASEGETALRRVVMRRALKSVFLCDSSKVGKKYLYRLGTLSDMDEIITDCDFPMELLPKK